jgi:hypothetical protein
MKRTYLDGSLDALDLDQRRLVETVRLHVDNLTGLAVNSPGMLAIGMLGLEIRQNSYQQTWNTGQNGSRYSPSIA